MRPPDIDNAQALGPAARAAGEILKSLRSGPETSKTYNPSPRRRNAVGRGRSVGSACELRAGSFQTELGVYHVSASRWRLNIARASKAFENQRILLPANDVLHNFRLPAVSLAPADDRI